MLRHLPEPLHSAVLHRGVGVKSLGDGLIDNNLLLFLKKLDQFLLGMNESADFPVGMVEEADDGGLFLECWARQMKSIKFISW